MLNLTIIILTKNERVHISRCLERLAPLKVSQIFIVDCFSDDGTQEIARKYGVTVIEHKWPGNQAVQFNWALDNLQIKSEWILRLDADEWLTSELILEIKKKLPWLDQSVGGVVFKRRNYFLGRWVKRGVYPSRIIRLFRKGKARYDDSMMMDEHLGVKGEIIEFEHDFVDESLMTLEEWKTKHRNYAKREAKMAITNNVNDNKKNYYKLPPYIRCFVYFCYRYLFRLGFIDGLEGLRWHFWQGLWYRCLVDKEIRRAKDTM